MLGVRRSLTFQRFSALRFNEFENSAPQATVRGDMRALLALEDGRFFEGESFGATGTRVGEVCFNTAMTGYQEVLTDPSYRGQIVAMTYPLIGNYGTNSLDQESRSPHVRGFVIEELSEIPSNWRSEMSLDEYLKKWNIPGVQGIDTRALDPAPAHPRRDESLFDYGRDFAGRSDAARPSKARALSAWITFAKFQRAKFINGTPKTN